jgi:hypothetical protein
MDVKKDPENPENLENTLTSAMGVKMDPSQQISNLVDSLIALRKAGTLSDEEFIRMMRALQDDNGAATMGSAPNDITNDQLTMQYMTNAAAQHRKGKPELRQ